MIIVIHLDLRTGFQLQAICWQCMHAWAGQTVEDSQYYDEGRDSWNQDPVPEAAGEETYSFQHEGLGYGNAF